MDRGMETDHTSWDRDGRCEETSVGQSWKLLCVIITAWSGRQTNSRRPSSAQHQYSRAELVEYPVELKAIATN